MTASTDNRKRQLIPVILSGGKGTRLWPVSRDARPKPFLKLADGRSLLQSTMVRAAELRAGAAVVVTNEAYYFQTEEDISHIRSQLSAMDVHYVLEPEGRNTAPAIQMAVRYVQETFGNDAVLLVMPSDHLVQDFGAFKDAVERALAAVDQDRLVTFGVEPTAPETGFGYIEVGEELSGLDVNAVQRFVEKPDRKTAESFLEGGCHVWNSGMFCFSVATASRAFAELAPDIHAQCEIVWKQSHVPSGAANILRLNGDAFGDMPDISFDYAIMEKSDRVAVARADIGWSDIGSWEAMSNLVSADVDGNRVVGRAELVDTRNTFIQSEDRLVATVGVQDLIIVDTPDALLVGSRKQSQQVKEIVTRLREKGDEISLLHRTVHRPWGTYTVIEEGMHYKIKRLVVKPGAALSLQMHHHRSEHWVVVDGTARVTNGDTLVDLVKDQSTYIPAGNKHRLENPGNDDVVIIETQTGDYLGEDDIVRFDDRYGRTEE